jgi:hypothetical protein
VGGYRIFTLTPDGDPNHFEVIVFQITCSKQRSKK